MGGGGSTPKPRAPQPSVQRPLIEFTAEEIAAHIRSLGKAYEGYGTLIIDNHLTGIQKLDRYSFEFIFV